ncbi:hypothetical protein [Salinicola aestuarinus]|uniref:hypothetical protein n=1 Tax=Salinicola aestuarinus TaxID=1949082 RepID=UPI000DA203D5|nr:hypothetical protein [Salinicola aestuarinus]
MIDYDKAKEEIKEEMAARLFLSKDDKELHYHIMDGIEEDMDSLRISEAGTDEGFYAKMAVLFLELVYELEYIDEYNELVSHLISPAHDAVREIIAEKLGGAL